MRFLISSFFGLGWLVSVGFTAENSLPLTGKVVGYYAEAEFTTPTLGDAYWATFRQTMEVQCPMAYNRPFVWHGPTTGFGVIKSVLYRAGNVVVSIRRFLVTRPQGGPWEVEAIERVEYLRKEKQATGTDIIESTTRDPTGKTLRHRFQPGPATPLDFITSENKSAFPAAAQPAAGLTETSPTTYLGFPAVQISSSRLQFERIELADDPRVPAELRHSVMAETRHSPKGEITMATRTLVLKLETFDASLLAPPTDVEEVPERR